jgi:hypothetical protein
MNIATSNLSLVFGEMVQVAEYSLATWEIEALVRQRSLLPRLWDKPTPRTPATGHHKRNTIYQALTRPKKFKQSTTTIVGRHREWITD